MASVKWSPRPNSPLSLQKTKWLSAPERDTSCPSASTATSPPRCWTTAPWWVATTGFKYWLAHNHRQLDRAGQPRGRSLQMEGREADESHCSTSHKDLAQRQYRLTPPPPCESSPCAIKENFSKQGHEFERRLCCATLTVLYGSSPRSLKPGLCCQVERKPLSSVSLCRDGALSSLPLSIRKIHFLSWIPRSTMVLLK